MAKQILMATVRGVFWAILGSFFCALNYLASIYLNPENRAGLVQGLIIGTGIFVMNLFSDNAEQRFFKKFWHGKFWLPFSVSTLVILTWIAVAWSFFYKLPYYQQRNGGSVLLTIVGLMGITILLTIVQLRISNRLRLRAQK